MKKFPIILIGFILNACFPARVLKYNVADIKDLNKFDKVTVANNPDQIFKFHKSTPSQQFKVPDYLELDGVEGFSKFMDKGKTVAFLVIRNDTILYEHYDKKYEEDTPIPSFSVSKSFVSTLLAIAIDDGFIKNTSEPITNYIPEFKDERMKNITIQHVLDMQAGFKFGENYFNPFSEVAKYYYGRDLMKFIVKLKAKNEPGKKFKYQSVNTQVLALIIERATKKNIAQYLEEKLWQPLQMEYPASWSVDDNGTVKAFCCINAKTRDFAKLGRLYLKNGNWDGKQIVSKEWINKTLYFKDDLNDFIYSNHWWHTSNKLAYSDTINFNEIPKLHKIRTDKKGNKKWVLYPNEDTFARGVLGQHVYIHAKKNIIIVRLGKGFGFTKWIKLLRAIAKEN